MKNFNDSMAAFWLDQWVKVYILVANAEDLAWWTIHRARAEQAWKLYQKYSS